MQTAGCKQEAAWCVTACQQQEVNRMQHGVLDTACKQHDVNRMQHGVLQHINSRMQTGCSMVCHAGFKQDAAWCVTACQQQDVNRMHHGVLCRM